MRVVVPHDSWRFARQHGWTTTWSRFTNTWQAGWLVGGLVEIFASLDFWLQTIEDRSECILKTSLCAKCKKQKKFHYHCVLNLRFKTFMTFSFSRSSQIRPSACRVKPIWNSAESRVLSPFTNPRTQKYDTFGTNTCSTAEFEAFLGDLCKKKWTLRDFRSWNNLRFPVNTDPFRPSTHRGNEWRAAWWVGLMVPVYLY